MYWQRLKSKVLLAVHRFTCRYGRSCERPTLGKTSSVLTHDKEDSPAQLKVAVVDKQTVGEMFTVIKYILQLACIRHRI